MLPNGSRPQGTKSNRGYARKAMSMPSELLKTAGE
jgi:hypothetical protein